MSFLWNSCGCTSAGLSELAIAGRSDILSYIKNKTCAKMPHLQFLESRFSVLGGFKKQFRFASLLLPNRRQGRPNFSACAALPPATCNLPIMSIPKQISPNRALALRPATCNLPKCLFQNKYLRNERKRLTPNPYHLTPRAAQRSPADKRAEVQEAGAALAQPPFSA